MGGRWAGAAGGRAGTGFWVGPLYARYVSAVGIKFQVRRDARPRKSSATLTLQWWPKRIVLRSKLKRYLYIFGHFGSKLILANLSYTYLFLMKS